MQPLYPYCHVHGKVSYPNPHEGYRDIAKRARKSAKKQTGHYRCLDCAGIHMVTIDKKRNR